MRTKPTGSADDNTDRRARNTQAQLTIAAAVGVLIHTMNLPMGGYDLQLYREMARTALEGRNPYAHPYADFPPLKMALLALLERHDLWYSAVVATEMVLVATLVAWVIRHYGDDSAACWAGILLYFAPSVFFLNWLATVEDKAIYSLLVLLLFFVAPWRHAEGEPMWSRRGAATAGAIVGLMAAYGGLGLPMLPVLILALLREGGDRRARVTKVVLLLGAFAFTAGGSHLLYFPEWLAGYERRAARLAALDASHVSLFQLAEWAGCYRPSLPAACALALTLVAYLKTLGGARAHYAFATVAFAGLAVRPENSYDAVLAALLPSALLFLDRTLFTVTITLLLAGIGYQFGMNDSPNATQLVLMWLPALIVLAALPRADLRLSMTGLRAMGETAWVRRRRARAAAPAAVESPPDS